MTDIITRLSGATASWEGLIKKLRMRAVARAATRARHRFHDISLDTEAADALSEAAEEIKRLDDDRLKWMNIAQSAEAEAERDAALALVAELKERGRRYFKLRDAWDYRVRYGADPGEDTEAELDLALGIEPSAAPTGEGELAALRRYRAVTHWIGADSWDGCSDCIERLKWAAQSDLNRDMTSDEIAGEIRPFFSEWHPGSDEAAPKPFASERVTEVDEAMVERAVEAYVHEYCKEDSVRKDAMRAALAAALGGGEEIPSFLKRMTGQSPPAPSINYRDRDGEGREGRRELGEDE